MTWWVWLILVGLATGPGEPPTNPDSVSLTTVDRYGSIVSEKK